MASPSPYNITLSSLSPTLKYSPARDGLMSLGWNVSYSGPSIPAAKLFSPLIKYGTGTPSSSTTLSGATLEFRFHGTAAYILGQAPAGSFTVSVDGQTAVSGQPDTAQGLLAGLTGLPNGAHTVLLTVTQAVQVSVSGTIVTIALGSPGVTPPSTTIEAILTDQHIRPNPFFDFRGPAGGPGWKMDSPKYTYTSDDIPILLPGAMITAGGKPSQGSTASFKLTEASAFFLRGSMVANATDDLFSVTITPPANVALPYTQTFSPNSSWEDPNEVLFWESGLDRNIEYGVTITSEVAGADTYFGFRSLEILDGGSFPTKADLNNSATSLSTSAFAGLAVLGVCALRRLFWI